MATVKRQKATTHNISDVTSGGSRPIFCADAVATVGNGEATIPPPGQGRPAKHDWKSIPVGGRVKGVGGMAPYWSRKLGRKFVQRGEWIYRVA